MAMPTPSAPKLPNSITPEQEKQAITAVKNGIPQDMNNPTLMKWAARAAKFLQNPIVARVVSCLAFLKGTPVSPQQVMIGAKIAQKAAEERKDELDRGISSSGPSFKP